MGPPMRPGYTIRGLADYMTSCGPKSKVRRQTMGEDEYDIGMDKAKGPSWGGC